MPTSISWSGVLSAVDMAIVRLLLHNTAAGSAYLRSSCFLDLMHASQDLKPELVYARISGYGQTGPKSHLPGYASVCEAYGGFRYIVTFICHCAASCVTCIAAGLFEQCLANVTCGKKPDWPHASCSRLQSAHIFCRHLS